MRDISQRLAVYTDDQGEPTRGATKAEVADLYEQLWDEFRESPVGQALLTRGGSEIMDYVYQIFSQRFPDKVPNKVGYFEALEEVGRDVLVTLPEPVAVAPAAVVVQPAVNAVAAAPAPEISKEAAQLSYMVRKQLDRLGVSSLKPRAGIITVVAENGTSYEYPVTRFNELYEEAQRFGRLDNPLIVTQESIVLGGKI